MTSIQSTQLSLFSDTTSNNQKLDELESRLLIRLNAYEKMIAELNQKDQQREQENKQLKIYVHKLEDELKLTKTRVRKLEVIHQKCCRDIKEIEAELIHSYDQQESKLHCDNSPLERRESDVSVHSDRQSGEKEDQQINTGEILEQIVLTSKRSSEATVLNLTENKLGVDEIKFLENHDWNHIIELNLTQTHLNDACLEIISKLSWNNLQRLHLALNMITDQGIDYILSMKLPKLKILDLYGNQISQNGVQRMYDHAWQSLQKMYIDNNDISEIAAINLRKCELKNCHHHEIDIKL